MFLGFAEGDQCADAEGEDANCNGGADSAVNILSVADFGDGGGWYLYNVCVVFREADLSDSM